MTHDDLLLHHLPVGAGEQTKSFCLELRAEMAFHQSAARSRSPAFYLGVASGIKH